MRANSCANLADLLSVCRYRCCPARLLIDPVDILAEKATNWANTNTDDRQQRSSGISSRDWSSARAVGPLHCKLVGFTNTHIYVYISWGVMITRWHVRRRLFNILFLSACVSGMWVNEGALLCLSSMLCLGDEGLLLLLRRLRHVAVLFKPIIKLSAEPLIRGRSTCVSFVVRWFFISGLCKGSIILLWIIEFIW